MIQYDQANKITEDRYTESPEIMLRNGDVLLTKDGSTIGTVNFVRDLVGPATVNGSIAVLTPTGELDGRYLYWFIASSYAQSIFDRLRGGMGVPHLFQRDINRIRMPRPPLPEQGAIANYLDRETTRIDTLIAEQQRLVAILRERRKAVVLHVVSAPALTGLVPDKIGRTARVGNGSTPRRDTTTYWDGGDFPWLNSSVVNESRVSQASQFVTEVALRECHLPIVPAGSILVGLTGQGKTRGMVTILDIEATVNQHVAYITPDLSLWIPDYLLWSLSAAYDELRRLSDENGSTKGGLTCEALKQFRLAMPSLDDQRRAAKYLQKQTQMIDQLIAETEQFIVFSKERRSALITAAVTGQIDVREPV